MGIGEKAAESTCPGILPRARAAPRANVGRAFLIATIDHRDWAPSTVGTGRGEREPTICDYFKRNRKRSDCWQRLGGAGKAKRFSS
jgi:hypothetical protein